MSADSLSDQAGPASLTEALYDVLVDEERGDFGVKPDRAVVAAALVAAAEKHEGDDLHRLRAENEALKRTLRAIEGLRALHTGPGAWGVIGRRAIAKAGQALVSGSPPSDEQGQTP